MPYESSPHSVESAIKIAIASITETDLKINIQYESKLIDNLREIFLTLWEQHPEFRNQRAVSALLLIVISTLFNLPGSTLNFSNFQKNDLDKLSNSLWEIIRRWIKPPDPQR